jgi:hypothetical protein
MLRWRPFSQLTAPVASYTASLLGQAAQGLPHAPFVRLDQSFQDAALIHMEVRTVSFLGHGWACPFGFTMEDDNVAHTLGCKQLSCLVQSCHDDVAKVLQSPLATWDSPAFARGGLGGTPGSCPTSPTARWDFYCNQELTTYSQTSRSSTPWPLRAPIRSSTLLPPQLLSGILKNAGTATPTIDGQIHAPRDLL